MGSAEGADVAASRAGLRKRNPPIEPRSNGGLRLSANPPDGVGLFHELRCYFNDKTTRSSSASRKESRVEIIFGRA
jgi:hypothetical protein